VTTTSILIREEQPADRGAIHAVNAAAFPTDTEARLVDALRDGAGLSLSLVAETAGEIVGHIAFSQVTVTRGDGTTAPGIGLAPMAVVPRLQRTGIGGRLIADGLRRLRDAGHGATSPTCSPGRRYTKALPSTPRGAPHSAPIARRRT
jgi:putative acetyltransferase